MSDDLTPAERSLRSSLAAHESWAKTTDRAGRTAKARKALEQKFLDQAGGDPARAESLRKAYFARLALKSVTARREASEARAQALAAERELRRLRGRAS